MMQAQSPLWMPDNAALTSSNMAQFMAFFNQREELACRDYPALHKASITHRKAFWSAIWDFCGVIGDKGDVILAHDTIKFC